jgi:2-polyprenyl-3-methyl-5-hydroxy-6-metoxy-1,4-benzoquinol methylase
MPALITLSNSTGRLTVETLESGQLLLHGEGRTPNIRVPHSPCRTTYPLPLIELIFDAYGAVHTCDEISRDTDDTEAALDVRYSVMAYFKDEVFSRPLLILDYGCGAGSSTITLARLFPVARITGVDLMPNLLQIAQRRAEHYGLASLRFEPLPQSAAGWSPATYDLVFLNAVYEHLLPSERPAVLKLIWSVLKPAGTLIINQTPHRWFPIETHTSGLLLINYVPKRVAAWAIRNFSRRDIRHASWEALLRAGVRGGSVGEIMRNIRRIDQTATRLRTIRLGKTWAAIWYSAKRARLGSVGSTLIRGAIVGAERIVSRSGLPFSPYVNIAVTKGHEPSSGVALSNDRDVGDSSGGSQ